MRLVVFLTLVLSSTLLNGAEPRRPNLVLILADDMGYADLGCTGAEIPTPHLDRLAAQGVLMTQFYNAARCCPTRASLLTGRYPHEAGMGDMVEGRVRRDGTFLPAYQGWLNEQAPTVAELLRAAGYRTYFSGKWHVGNEDPHWPDRRGFERTFAMIHGAASYFEDVPWIAADQFRRLHRDGQPYSLPPGAYLTDTITEHALDFLDAPRGGSPFFLYLAYTAPHWPLHAPEEDIARFVGRYQDGWDALRVRRMKRMQELGLIPAAADLPPPYRNASQPVLTPEWETLSSEERQRWDRRMATYAAQVFAMDRAIGRLVAALEARGELDDTLLVFLSDNGATDAAIYRAKSWVARRDGPIGSARSFDSYGGGWASASNGPFRLFKTTVAEGGIRTPLIAHYPRQLAPRVVKETYGHVIDLLPTFLGLAGAAGAVPAAADGVDLLPAWRGEPSRGERLLFWEHQGHFAVRAGNWKLLHVARTKDWGRPSTELFNLAADPAELHDLSRTESGKLHELQRAYDAWARRVGVEPWDSLQLARPM